MFQSTKDLARKVADAHGELLIGLRKPSQDVSTAFNVNEFADYAYAMKECADLLESLQKAFREKQRTAETLICQLVVRDGIMGAVETEYVKATPDAQIGVSIPGYTKDRPAFDAVMEGMGVPESLWKGLERPLCKLDYPAMSKYLGDLAAQAKPFPPALANLKRSQVVSVKLRGRKGVTE